ncbi:MAG TPA: TonB family protein [Thermoanaerobaculia bacterium]
MASKNKPFEQFGQYLLFKRLEADALGEMWRAGRIDGEQLGPTVALRRFTGGHREELAATLAGAAQIIPQFTGTSFARDQVAGVANGIGYLAWDYAGGRSLRHIIDKARGNASTPANPIPLDQAIVIAEKVALSLATTSDLRTSDGQKLTHGALLPHFIWISDDGEIRVGGQQLGYGIIRSFIDPRSANEMGHYVSPEYRESGKSTQSAEVFSLGAILFLVVTGQEPPDATTSSAYAQVVRATKTMAGTAIPDDIRAILDKSLVLDPAQRYKTVAEMKQAISSLVNNGNYSATTFNLAFYLSNLLKKELEGEAVDREREAKVDLEPYLQPEPAPVVAAAPAAAPRPAAPMFAAAEPKKKSKAPLYAAAATVVLAAVGAGGYFMLNKPQPAAPKVAAASVLPTKPAAPPRIISEAVVVAETSAAPATATTGTVDPAAQQKAFEEAVKARMAEMMKLQEDFNRQLQKDKSKNAPVQTTSAAPAPAEERPSMSAAQLDAQRREAATPAPTATVPTQTVAQQQPAAIPAPVQAQSAAPAPEPVQQARVIREGEVIDVNELDTLPRPLKQIRPSYPPVAMRQRVEGSVIATVFVSETGDVLEVRVLRGAGFGLDEAAVRALKAARFSPPMKDGKRVRTWYPQTIVFKL